MSDYLSAEQCDFLLHDFRICVECRDVVRLECGAHLDISTRSSRSQSLEFKRVLLSEFVKTAFNSEKVLEAHESYRKNMDIVMRQDCNLEGNTATTLPGNGTSPEKRAPLISLKRKANLALPPIPVKKTAEKRVEPLSDSDIYNEEIEYDVLGSSPIGSGTQGYVRVVQLESSSDMKYAMKYFKSSFTDNERWKELDNLRKVGRHSSVVQLIGIVYESPSERTSPLGYIMTFFPEGNLSEAIYGRDGRPGRSYRHADILRWTAQLCAALQHCHNNGVVHSDVNPKNIMMHSDYTKVVLIDFGSSASTDKDADSYQGTINYMCPEMISAEKIRFTPEIDVYSLCMTICEMVHRSVPYGLENEWKLGSQILKGKRPEFGDNFPLQLRQLLERGWSADPEKRPSLKEIRIFCMKELDSTATNLI